MKKFEKIFSGVLLGCLFPFLCCFLAMIIWFYTDKNENHAPYYFFAGLVMGLIIDFRYLKGWIERRYELQVWYAVGIYIVYNTAIYGMFMGFPVFNTVMALIAGYYWGNRVLFLDVPEEKQKKMAIRISRFTGLIMILICISSGFLALAGKGAGEDIRGMLGLEFTVTKAMVLGIVLAGGTALILVQMWLTRMAMMLTIGRSFKT